MKIRSTLIAIIISLLFFTIAKPAFAEKPFIENNIKLSKSISNAEKARENNLLNENVQYADVNIIEMQGNEWLEIMMQQSKAEANKQTISLLGEKIALIIDKLNISDLSLKSTALGDIFETEPNDTTETANPILLNYNVFGTITDYYDDLDCYRLQINNSGMIGVGGAWMGDYAGYGLEDDLLIGLFDSNENLIQVSQYLQFDGTILQYLEVDILPGTYYIAVLQNQYSQYSYVGAPYFLIALMDNTSIPVQSVSLKKGSTSITKGNTETLTATVLPSDASNKSVNWTSSNTSVATVDANGLVTAVEIGTATITATTADGGFTASCMITVPDIQAIEDFVTRFYQLCLFRDPDTGGLNYWVDLLATGQQTGADISQGFIFSDEFIASNITDNDFLNILYSAFFDRAADSGGMAYWQSYLDNGMSRLFVLSNFVNSDEFSGICNDYGITRGSIQLTEPADLNPDVTAFVNRFFVICMDREPDSGGLNYWVDQLVTGQQTGAGISQGFIFSDEFTAKNLSNTDFITVMYRVFFDREPDSGGQSYWVGVLNAGTSRLEVLSGFVGSSEFAALCSGIGIEVGVVSY
jgi:uncharacterized protein YjdB